MATSDKTGMEKEISELRSEVYEARNLVIKSDNLLRTLHAEVKAVGKIQERFEKRHLISSAVAYVLFVCLAAGAAVWVASSTSKAGRVAADAELAEMSNQVETARQEAEEARGQLEGRLEAEAKAAEIHRLLSSEEPQEQRLGLDEMEKADLTQAPALLRRIVSERADAVRREIVSRAWERGRSRYLAEQTEEAIESLALVERYGRYLPADFEPSSRAMAAYYLGAARNKLGQHEEAVPVLRSYIESEHATRSTLAFAHLLLGDSLSAVGRAEEARSVYTSGLEMEPAGRHASVIRRRLDRLASAEPAAD
ncbi:MAG: hypothetical protein ACOCVR_00675 [Myxococcota bacterium]